MGTLIPTSQGTIVAYHSEAAGDYYPNMKTFREALLEAVKTGNPSLRAVALASGVSYEQLKKLKQGKTQNTNIEDARRIAAYFGKTVEDFIEAPEMRADIELAEIASQLEPVELEFPLSVGQAQIDKRNPAPEQPDEDAK